MYPVRRLLTAAVVVTAAAVMMVASAQADIAKPVTCALKENIPGFATLKAGPVTLRATEVQQTRGILQSFLNGQTTTWSWRLNGVGTNNPFSTPGDLSSNWTDATPNFLGSGFWWTRNDFQTDLTIVKGDKLEIRYNNNLSHRLPEVYNPASPDGGGVAGKPLFRGPDTPAYTCTYTGV